MRVIISAGGTGGHIYPALAIINKIKEKEPNSEILYIGTHNRMEKELIPKYGIPYEEIKIIGFDRKNILHNFKTINYFIKSYSKCKKIIKKFDPDIVIGIGGYVTGPVIYSAKNLGYKTFIHEQNSIPGKTNQFLSKYVNKIGISLKSSAKYFPNYKTVFTGNPASEEALKIAPCLKREFNLDEQKKLVLIVMGSLGSSKMNDILINSMSLFNNKDYEVLYVTGNEQYETISKNKFPTNVRVVPYIDKMARVMKKTDLIITRAGATTLSEIISLKIPSILIPSPYVTNNHQYKNAMDLVNKDSAFILEEKDIKGDILVRKIDSIINNDKQLNYIKNNLKQFEVKNSATKIYETLKNIVDRK